MHLYCHQLETEDKAESVFGMQDLRIAAIALSVNGTLVTRDRRDFVKVPDLLFADRTLAAV